VKKILLFLLIFLNITILSLDAQQDSFQHLEQWNSVERDLYRLAVEFVRTRRTDPNRRSTMRIDIKPYLFIDYNPTRNIYSAGIPLDTAILQQLSIRIGAAYKFELLYGSPEVVLVDDGLVSTWNCSSWYRLARTVKLVSGDEVILLEFQESDL